MCRAINRMYMKSLNLILPQESNLYVLVLTLKLYWKKNETSQNPKYTKTCQNSENNTFAKNENFFEKHTEDSLCTKCEGFALIYEAMNPKNESELPLSVMLSEWPGPVFCLLLRVSSDYAQPITGQVTEVTCPVIGRAQPELNLSKRQKTGPGVDETQILCVASSTGCMIYWCIYQVSDAYHKNQTWMYCFLPLGKLRKIHNTRRPD